MARSISLSLGGVLELLELNRPELVTIADMNSLGEQAGLGIPGRLIASRLKERGWLLDTPQRGVWEFVPAEAAGAYSSADPLLPLKAFRLANPNLDCALTFQSAAWAMGLADRIPSRIETAFSKSPKVKVPDEIDGSTYRTNLPLVKAKGADALSAEGIIVHMLVRPSAVRSWHSAREWLPDVAYGIDGTHILRELENRPASVWARAGYLLCGMRPDIAAVIRNVFTPTSKTHFGRNGAAMRNDERWLIADSTLPFDPRKMESVQ